MIGGRRCSGQVDAATGDIVDKPRRVINYLGRGKEPVARQTMENPKSGQEPTSPAAPAANRDRPRAGDSASDIKRKRPWELAKLNRFTVVSLAALLAILPEPVDEAPEQNKIGAP